ncbi:MAG: inositol monophosphatase [Acidimicrobiales bacterium]|nr:inositol monophosphatase [Acidimicrobiales bacterium]
MAEPTSTATGEPQPAGADLEELLALAVSLAARAARLLVDGLGHDRRDVSTKSTATDLVTEMDRAAERLVVDGLLDARPDDTVVGEEGADRGGSSGVRWLVDPIDGTTNYVYGLPGFSVSLAAQVSGRTVVGVVHDPLHGDVFTAARGRGSWRNDHRLSLGPGPELATALVATGFSYAADRRARQAEVLTRVLPAVRDIRRGGAASVDLCWVACGRVDAYYEKGLQAWDHAAGVLIAEEAGARTGDLAGGPASSAFVLAARPGLFDPLQALLTAAGAAHA